MVELVAARIAGNHSLSMSIELHRCEHFYEPGEGPECFFKYFQNWRSQSGKTDNNSRFLNWCLIQINDYKDFKLECAGCCWQYLVYRRCYSSESGRFGNRVQFIRYGEAPTHMYLDCPPQGRKGIVKVGKKSDVNPLPQRPVQQSRSYQFYSLAEEEPEDSEVFADQLSMEKNVNIRLEAIRVDKIQGSEQLNQCYFSYCDAALLEIWRESEGLSSLDGICYSSGPPTTSYQPMTMKNEPSEIITIDLTTTDDDDDYTD